jgi:hypothetical protein
MPGEMTVGHALAAFWIPAFGIGMLLGMLLGVLSVYLDERRRGKQ